MEEGVNSTESLEQKAISLCKEAAESQLDNTSSRDNKGFSFIAQRNILKASITMTWLEEQGNPIWIHRHTIDVARQGSTHEDQWRLSLLFNTL